VISFARGAAAPECLPVHELAACAKAALERDGVVILSYGPGGGYVPLREWLAAQYGVEPSRVLITSGSLQGFVFLAEALVSPGARVLVEAPTYDRPLKILSRLGATIETLAVDDDGIDPDDLERALRNGDKPAFLYTIPTFQNPSGQTLSGERRRRIAELAAEHELPVLEDDPYRLVHFEGELPPTLFELEGGTNVMYSSSFSKTVSTGMRVGWFVLPPALAKQLEARAVDTYISPPYLPQATIYELIDGGAFEPTVARVNELLKLRRDAMSAALDEHFPGTPRSRPHGGYFLWVDLPEGTDTAALLERAAAEGVTFVPGSGFFPNGGGESSIRLAYSWASPAEISDGIALLAAAAASVPV
jgi:2-aminoadipate transaminase